MRATEGRSTAPYLSHTANKTSSHQITTTISMNPWPGVEVCQGEMMSRLTLFADQVEVMPNKKSK